MSTDQLETDVLAQAREGLRPTEQRRAQLLQRLALGAAGAPLAPLSPSPDSPSLVRGERLRALLNGSGRVMFTQRAVGLALLTGAAMGLGGAHLLGMTERTSSAPVIERALTADEKPTARGVDGAEVPGKENEALESMTTMPSPVELIALPEEDATGLSGPKGEAATKRDQASEGKAKRGAAQPPPAEASFYEELSYVRRAQAALRDGQSALALGLMETLDSMPNKGALWAERNVTKVLALCQLERADEAKVIAARLARADTGQVYRKRLEASCAGAPQESGTTEKK